MADEDQTKKPKSFLEKAFPERQIYQRVGGSVRYFSLSPWRQLLFAGSLSLVIGWCLFATVVVLLRGPGFDVGASRINASLERELRQSKASEVTALTLLSQRTAEFKRQVDLLQQQIVLYENAVRSEGAENSVVVSLNRATSDLALAQSRAADLDRNLVDAREEAKKLRAEVDDLRMSFDLSWLYRWYKGAKQSLEPKYSPSPEQSLAEFEKFVTVLLGAFATGFGLVFGLIFTGIAARLPFVGAKSMKQDGN